MLTQASNRFSTWPQIQTLLTFCIDALRSAHASNRSTQFIRTKTNGFTAESLVYQRRDAIDDSTAASRRATASRKLVRLRLGDRSHVTDFSLDF
jgi:hypothetical protein